MTTRFLAAAVLLTLGGCAGTTGSDNAAGADAATSLCVVPSGFCPNFCERGTATQGSACKADSDCACGMRCQVDCNTPQASSCPNLCTTGKGVQGESCAGPNDCACGLGCFQNTCEPYKDALAGCSCTAGTCQPFDGALAGCSCGGGAPACVPNKTESCPCAGGGAGTQVCNAAGTGYSPCDGGGGGPADVSQPTPDTATPTPDAGPPPTDPGATCLPKSKKACQGNTAVWLDSCGELDVTIQECPTGTGCSQGICTGACTPHAEQRCVGNHVYWFDSCAKKESIAKQCADEEFCKGCVETDAVCAEVPSCVKPFYSGNWTMTANPSSKDLCGLGNASYPQQVLKLVVDGSVATGSITVLGNTVNYTGSVTGKTMTLESHYTVSGLTDEQHDEKMEVTFTSGSVFTGIHQDGVTVDIGIGEPFTCTVYWNVTGQRQ